MSTVARESGGGPTLGERGLWGVWDSVAGWADDRVNPIVVKELRQAVKSKFIVSVLMLLLAVLVLVQLLFVMNSTTIGRASSDEGRSLFMIFQSVLLGLTLLCVPLYVGVRLTAERSSATSDLLYVTTIRPWSIVWGKLAAGMVVTLLIFSACAPFMVVTYLLRGIDPPTVLFVLGLDFMLVLSATVVAVTVGALPLGWPIKLLLGMVLLAALVMTFVGMTSFLAFEVLRGGVGASFGDAEFWWAVLATLSLWCGCLGVLGVLTVAMITPEAANRALPVRAYITALWAVAGMVLVGMAWYYEDAELVVAWPIASALVLLPGLVLATSEREVLGPRMRRSVPTRGLWRLLVFPLYSGAAGGIVWAAGLFAVTLVLSALFGDWVAQRSGGSGFGGWSFFTLGCLAVTGLFVLGYAMLGVVMRRLFLRRPRQQLATAAVVLTGMMCAMIVPIFLAYLLNPQRWDLHEEGWLFLNPLAPVVYSGGGYARWSEFHQLLLIIAGSMAAVGGVVNLPWFWRQWANFRPVEAEVAAKTDAGVSDG